MKIFKIYRCIFFALIPFLLFSISFMAPTLAQQPNIVQSFDSPGDHPEGLAWDGQYLWNADYSLGGMIYKLTTTGHVVSNFSSPGANPRGLAWDGKYLWHANAYPGKIYKLDPSDGHVVKSFDAPGEKPEGLAWDGEYLWNADSGSDKIYQLDPSDGHAVNSFDAPVEEYYHDPGGLAWDGLYLWNVCDNKIYRLDPSTGIVVFSIDSPSNESQGLAWDGEYLWNADRYEDKIYKIAIVAQLSITSLKMYGIYKETEPGRTFTVEATISNTGTTAAKNVNATIHLPDTMVVTSGSKTQNVGTISAGGSITVTWSVLVAKARETAYDYGILKIPTEERETITVTVSSSNAGSDFRSVSILVKVTPTYRLVYTNILGIPILAFPIALIVILLFYVRYVRPRRIERAEREKELE